MEGSILELLEQHGSLGYEQIATLLGKPPDAVQSALRDLQDSGFVDAITVGKLEGAPTTAAAYWRLTDKGRARSCPGGAAGGVGARSAPRLIRQFA